MLAKEFRDLNFTFFQFVVILIIGFKYNNFNSLFIPYFKILYFVADSFLIKKVHVFYLSTLTYMQRPQLKARLSSLQHSDFQKVSKLSTRYQEFQPNPQTIQTYKMQLQEYFCQLLLFLQIKHLHPKYRKGYTMLLC